MNRREKIVLDGLFVMRGVARIGAVEIEFADFERIFVKLARHAIDDCFDDRHALRTAETAEGGIRWQIGLAYLADDAEIWNEIRVIGMEHCAFHDGVRKIGRTAAIAEQVDVYGKEPAVAIERRFVFREEAVAFAGDDHVFIAVEADLDRPLRRIAKQRGPACVMIPLRFFAAEAAAHAPHFDDHVMFPDAQHLGNSGLRFGWVLRRTTDKHLFAFTRDAEARLGFKIPMLLCAGAQLAAESMRSEIQRFGHFAPFDGCRLAQETVLGDGVFDGENGIERLVFDANLAFGFAALLERFGRDEDDRLPYADNFILCKTWFVFNDGAHFVTAGDIFCRQDGEDAGDFTRISEIERLYPRVCMGAGDYVAGEEPFVNRDIVYI